MRQPRRPMLPPRPSRPWPSRDPRAPPPQPPGPRRWGIRHSSSRSTDRRANPRTAAPTRRTAARARGRDARPCRSGASTRSRWGRGSAWSATRGPRPRCHPTPRTSFPRQRRRPRPLRTTRTTTTTSTSSRPLSLRSCSHRTPWPWRDTRRARLAGQPPASCSWAGRERRPKRWLRRCRCSMRATTSSSKAAESAPPYSFLERPASPTGSLVDRR
mmetsp:Transcript_58127/g.173478  ORF Transcript_58127/g.173478 Transcript_58127/m.173478 type:complete len:215 (+) Transcript_58127:1002-1646(+)